MARAFPERSDCPAVPTIQQIEGSLVDPSQDVSDPPRPVYEFPFFNFPPPDPPVNDFGCFAATLSATLAESSNASLSAVITYPESSETGKCQPVIRIDLRVPPCPNFGFTTSSIGMKSSLLAPTLDFGVSRRTGGEACAFDIDFDLKLPQIFPCTDFVFTTSSVSIDSGLSDPTLNFNISRRTGPPEACNFDIIFDLKLPPTGTGCHARMASTGDVSRSGIQTIDGVDGSDGDVVLLKDQAAANTNGTYAMRSGTWDRTCSLVGGSIVTVREGDTNGVTAWMITTNDPIVIGSTPLEFELISGAACCCYARVATLEDITLSGTQTIDGIALSEGDIVLVKNQADATMNGPYTVESTAWTRICEINSGHSVNVREGLLQACTVWMLVTNGEIDLGSTMLSYHQVIDRPTARVCTTCDRARSGLAVQDGITLSVDDVVLMAGQDPPSENGLYLVKAGTWVRTGEITPGMIVAIREGSVWGAQTFILSSYSSNPIVLESTSLTFSPLRMVVKAAAALDKGPDGQPGQALSGTPTIDDVVTVAGSVVLVFNSTSASENGVWVAGTGGWWQAVTADINNSGMIIPVKNGTRFGQVSFMITGSATPCLSIMGITGVVGPA